MRYLQLKCGVDFFKLEVTEECVKHFSDKDVIKNICQFLMSSVPPHSKEASERVKVNIGRDGNGNEVLEVRHPKIPNVDSPSASDGKAGVRENEMRENTQPPGASTADVRSPPRKKANTATFNTPKKGSTEGSLGGDEGLSEMLSTCSPFRAQGNALDKNSIRAVLFKNIPSAVYNEDAFKIFLDQTLKMKGISQDGIEIVSSIGQYNASSESVVVELENPDHAATLLSLKDLNFFYHDVVLEPAQAKCNSYVNESRHLKLSKIPPSIFNEEAFKVFLHETLRVKGISEAGLKVVTYISPYDAEEEAVVIELESVELLVKFLSLESLKYMYHSIHVEPVMPPTVKQRELKQSTSQPSSLMSASTEDLEAPPLKKDETQPKPSSAVNTDPATVALLHELIVRREQVLGRTIKKTVMTSIIEALSDRFTFNEQDIRDKKSYLIKYYTSRKRQGDQSWRFYDLVGQLVGDITFEGVFAELKTNSARVLWQEGPTLALIHEFGKRKDLLDRTLHKNQIWQEIAAAVVLVFPNMKVDGHDCESKWKLFRATYLDFKANLERSGGDAVVVDWPFYEVINSILHSSVAAEPSFTFACGTSQVTKRKNTKKSPMDSSEEDGSGPRDREAKRRDAKPRLSNAARKLELDEKKLEMQREYLAMLAAQLASKK